MEASSAINAPHSDDPNPDDFFGDGDDTATAAAPDAPAAETQPAPDAPAPEVETPAPAAAPSGLDPVDEEPAPVAEPDAPAEPPAAPAEPEQPAPAEPEPAQPPADPAPAEPAAPAETPGEGDGQQQQGEGDGNAAEQQPEASGTPSRNYVVLREIKLTPDTLRALLEEAEKGNEGSYRVAHFELDVVEARNVKGALAETFNKHSERLGQRLRLTPIPQRTWATKTIEPQQRTVSSLNIT